MKYFKATFTSILALMALQLCQANPVSIPVTVQKRQLPRSFLDSLTAKIGHLAAEAKEAVTPYLNPGFVKRSPSGSQQLNSTPLLFAKSTDTYTIETGDTFSLIAAKLGTTVEELENANPEVVLEDLQIGEVVVIPGAFGGVANETTAGNETFAGNGTPTGSETAGGNGTAVGNETIAFNETAEF
jgi:LysM repeat protein